jgi:hypothetical protein
VSDPAIIGVQSCGCITFALAREAPSKDDEKALMRIVREGGSVVHTTVDAARAMPHFLPVECPHDPKGWEFKKPEPFKPHLGRAKYISSRDIWVVNIATYGWEHGRFRAGEVREWDGQWWATEGWFRYREAGAENGDGKGTPISEFGPFKTKKAAMEHLLPLGVKRAEEFRAKWVKA